MPFRYWIGMLGAAAAAALAAVALTGPGAARGTTYYVSPTGNDAHSGRSAAQAWRTVKRVDEAKLVPGDTILFQGGARFADSPLTPPASGRAGAPITFSSYGGGRANITQGIWFASRSHLVFDRLAVDTGLAHPPDGFGLQSSAGGTGSTDVVVRGSSFEHVRTAIMLANRADARWTIEGNTIRWTRDSGIIVLGHDATFTRNTILDTGQDPSIPYGKHGVYAKGPDLTFRDNVISRFSADGLSLRYHGAVVVDNRISGGMIGIAWFQQDHAAGTSRIVGNRISATTDSGLYVSPEDAAGATRESFVIADNAIVPRAGNAIDIQRTSGSVALVRNRLGGPFAALHLVRPGGRLET